MRTTGLGVVHFVNEHGEAVLLELVNSVGVGTSGDLAGGNGPLLFLFLGAQPLQEFHAGFLVGGAGADTEVLAADGGGGGALFAGGQQREVVGEAVHLVGHSQVPGAALDHGGLTGAELIPSVGLGPVDAFLGHIALVDQSAQGGHTGNGGGSGQVVNVHALAVLHGAQPGQHLEGAFLGADAAHCHAVNAVGGIGGGSGDLQQLVQALGSVVVAGGLQQVHVHAQSQAVGVLGQTVQAAVSIHAGAQGAGEEFVQLAPGFQLIGDVSEDAQRDVGSHVGGVHHADVGQLAGNGADDVLVHQLVTGHIGGGDVDVILQGVVFLDPIQDGLLVVGRIEIVPQGHFVGSLGGGQTGQTADSQAQGHGQSQDQCQGFLHVFVPPSFFVGFS